MQTQINLPPIFLAKLEWILFIRVVTNEQISGEQKDGEEETAAGFFSAGQNIRALLFLRRHICIFSDANYLLIWLPKQQKAA